MPPRLIATVSDRGEIDDLLETPWGEPKPPEMEFSILAVIFTIMLGILVGVLISREAGRPWVRWLTAALLLLVGIGVLWLSANSGSN